MDHSLAVLPGNFNEHTIKQKNENFFIGNTTEPLKATIGVHDVLMIKLIPNETEF